MKSVLNYRDLLRTFVIAVVTERSVSAQSSQSRSSRLASPLSPLSPLTHSSLVCNPSETHWNVNTLSRYTHTPWTLVHLRNSIDFCISISCPCRDMVVCISKESVCELETDALATDIVNRHELSMGMQYNSLFMIIS